MATALETQYTNAAAGAQAALAKYKASHSAADADALKKAQAYLLTASNALKASRGIAVATPAAAKKTLVSAPAAVTHAVAVNATGAASAAGKYWPLAAIAGILFMLSKRRKHG